MFLKYYICVNEGIGREMVWKQCIIKHKVIYVYDIYLNLIINYIFIA